MYSQTDYLNRDVELPLGSTHVDPESLDTDLPQDDEELRQRLTTLTQEDYLQLGIDYTKVLDRTVFCNNQFFFIRVWIV